MILILLMVGSPVMVLGMKLCSVTPTLAQWMEDGLSGMVGPTVPNLVEVEAS